jgi:hypothetical protein
MTRSQKIATFVFLGLPCFCWLGGVGYVQYQLNKVGGGLEAELARSKALGLPTTPDALSRNVPDSENAAPYYLKAMSLIGDGTQEKGYFDDVSRSLSTKEKPEEKAKAEEAFPKLAGLIVEVEKAADRPRCDFKKDWKQGFNVMFPEYADLKGFAKLLGYKAERQSKSGDWRGALKSVERMQSISRHAGEEPIIIAMLVRIADEAITHATLRHLVRSHSDNPAFLDAARKVAVGFGPLPSFRHGLEGEMVLGRTGLYQIRSLSDISGGGPTETDPFTKIAFNSKSLKTAFDRKLVEAYNNYFERMPKDASDWKGMAKASREQDEWIQSDKSLLNTFNQILFPVFSQAAQAIGRTQAQRNLTLTSIDLWQKKLSNGHLPATVSGKDAMDPFTDRPLIYKRFADGFLIYSVDQDGRDDGGQLESSNGKRDLVVDMRAKG